MQDMSTGSLDIGSEPTEPRLPAIEAEPTQPILPAVEMSQKQPSAGPQQVPVEPVLSRQTKQHSSRKGQKLFAIVLFCLALQGTLLSVVSAYGYQTYTASNTAFRHYLAVAQTGVQHLQTAEQLLAAFPQNPFDAQRVEQAQHEFNAGLANFVQLNNALKAIPASAASIPVYGARLSGALHVVPIAIEVAQAGLIGCDSLKILINSFHTMLVNKSQQGLSAADIATIKNGLQQLKAIFSLVTDQVKHLSASDLQLDPRLGKLVAAFHSYAPLLLSSFDDLGALLPVIPTLLGIGKPANYMIEILDMTELRPGGGFIGNYGVITMENGRQAGAHITDIDLLDRPFEAAGNAIPYPPQYQWFDLARNWSLRDTNLDADFPTVARYSQQNYKREGGPLSFEGVVAITPILIQNMIQVTGPIAVPEYHETITAQNLTARIHYHQLAAEEGLDTVVASDGKSSQRKHFTALLAEHFMAQFHQLPADRLGTVGQLLIKALRTKDLQVYFNSPIAQSLLQRYQVDSTIRAPGNDSLFVVDANIAPSKANQFIIDKMDDQVTLDAQGNALHTTKLSYSWTLPGPVYGSELYRDYLRVYIPPGSTLKQQDGWEPRGTGSAFGRTFWSGFFTLKFGQTRVITLQWSVPKAATKDVTGWHYNYLLQHQAGTRWTTNVQLTLPACAQVKKTSGPLKYSNQHAALPAYTLDEDTTMGFDYAGC